MVDYLLDDALRPLGCDSVYTVYMPASAEPVLDFVQEPHGHQHFASQTGVPSHTSEGQQSCGIYDIPKHAERVMPCTNAPLPWGLGGWVDRALDKCIFVLRERAGSPGLMFGRYRDSIQAGNLAAGCGHTGRGAAACQAGGV